MKKIGLTGGIACGKSTVADILRNNGIPVIDADKVAREVVEPDQPALQEIVHRFGKEVLLPTGHLNRGALGEIVMTDPSARQALEHITHPRIFQQISQRLQQHEQNEVQQAVVESALMVETGNWRNYDALLVVACSPEVQIQRLMARQNFDRGTANKWIASQVSIQEKVSVATAVVHNDGPKDELLANVAQAWEKIIRHLYGDSDIAR